MFSKIKLNSFFSVIVCSYDLKTERVDTVDSIFKNRMHRFSVRNSNRMFDLRGMLRSRDPAGDVTYGTVYRLSRHLTTDPIRSLIVSNSVYFETVDIVNTPRGNKKFTRLWKLFFLVIV